MLCPQCKTPLSIAERSNIEIDFCPTCRGVWLDRGELDKLIDRAVDTAPPPQPTPSYAPQPYGHPGKHRDHGYYKHNRKKSILSEIFDF